MSKIKAAGLWINFSGTVPGASVLTGDPNAVICVVPILFYNTGSTHKEVVDFSLIAKFGETNITLSSNHFMQDIGEKGSHNLPTSKDWAHQLIVKPKDSEMRYVEFVNMNLTEGEGMSIKKNLRDSEEVVFELQIMNLKAAEFFTESSFTISCQEIKSNEYGNQYTIYRT